MSKSRIASVAGLIFSLMALSGCKENEREQEILYDIQNAKEIVESYSKKKGHLYKNACGDVRLELGYLYLELSNVPDKKGIENLLPIGGRFRRLVRIVEFIEDIEEFRERDPIQDSLYRNAKNTIKAIFKDNTQIDLVRQYNSSDLKKSFLYFHGAWSDYRDFKYWLEP